LAAIPLLAGIALIGASSDNALRRYHEAQCAHDHAAGVVRRIVKLRDQKVRLSPKEYELLRLLIHHAGKVLTHKFLLRELWVHAHDSQYLRVYVRQLRQKIEPDPARPEYILTETGIGYRLRAPD